MGDSPLRASVGVGCGFVESKRWADTLGVAGRTEMNRHQFISKGDHGPACITM